MCSCLVTVSFMWHTSSDHSLVLEWSLSLVLSCWTCVTCGDTLRCVGTFFEGPASPFPGSSCELDDWTIPCFGGIILGPHWSGEFWCNPPAFQCWLLPISSSSWAISGCLQQRSWILWDPILLSMSQGEPVLLPLSPGWIFPDPFLQCLSSSGHFCDPIIWLLWTIDLVWDALTIC